jgi:hypothetical protein
MDELKDSQVAEPVTMQHYRERYRRNREEFRRKIAEYSIEDCEILDVKILPRSVNVKENRGDEQELARAIELYYKNSGL